MRVKPLIYGVALTPILASVLLGPMVGDPDTERWLDIAAFGFCGFVLFLARGKDGWIGDPPQVLQERLQRIDKMLSDDVDWSGVPLSDDLRGAFRLHSQKLSKRVASAKKAGLLD